MTNLDNKIKAIVIPTGGSPEEDLERALKAMEYNEKNRIHAPYLISGLGPDSDEVISKYYYEGG